MLNNPQLRRRRFWLGALLLGLTGALAGGAFCTVWLVQGRQAARLTQAAQHLQQALADAGSFGAAALEENRQERRQREQRLAREAADVCGNVQLFLQTALIRQEARRLSEQNATLQTGNEELSAILRKQTAIASRLAGALVSTGLVPAAPEPADPSATPSAAPAPVVSAISLSEEDKIKLLQEYATLQHQATKLTGASANPEAAPEAAGRAEGLLRECAADLENLLPARATLAISEAGGRMLLALGASGDGRSLRQEATRNLLLPAGKDNHHLVLRVALSDPDAAAAPSAGELAQRLAIRLGHPAGATPALALMDANGQPAGVYPPGTRDDWNAPSEIGRWVQSAAKSVFVATLAPQPPLEYTLAARIELPALPLREQLQALAEDNPVGAIGFAVALVLLLAGVAVQARLAWQRETAEWSSAAASLAQMVPLTQPEACKPALGSLERLQQANRGRIGDGSHILDLAKSPVLRELAARVRGPKPAAKDARPSLREYNRSRQ